MSLPSTPLPVVFKNNRSINKAYSKDLPMIKGSTQMGKLPLNTLVVMRNNYTTSYRYVGNSAYSYTEWYHSNTGGYLGMNGGIENLDLLNEMVETVNRIQPFVSKLFSK